MQAPSHSFRPRRSVLYLPASNSRAVEKSRGAPCDVVILDLEDAVAPERKSEARAAAVAAAAEGGFGRRELLVRCNGLDTPWGRDDLDALRAAAVDAVLVPKPSSAADLAAYHARLNGKPVWAMVETCAAVLGIAELAGAARDLPLQALVLGPNDLAKEMRCTAGPDRAPLQPALAAIVMAARANGLTPLDGVWNALDDLEGLEREARQGAAFGFEGKTVIHPKHLDACNRAFSPSAEQAAWARRIVEAYALPENATAGAIRLDGQLVERLHLEAARRDLAIAAIDSPPASGD